MSVEHETDLGGDVDDEEVEVGFIYLDLIL